VAKNPEYQTSEARKRIMRSIRSKNTRPELTVRRMLHRLGYRFRLHRPDLPGSPDLVFPARRKVIFVNGCFWHFHSKCPAGRIPRSRVDFWKSKLSKTRARDKRNLRALKALGWDVEVVWECELDDTKNLSSRLVGFLDIPASTNASS
jgi:DNA mismatch endonuclease (patch repair protein)